MRIRAVSGPFGLHHRTSRKSTLIFGLVVGSPAGGVKMQMQLRDIHRRLEETGSREAWRACDSFLQGTALRAKVEGKVGISAPLAEV